MGKVLVLGAFCYYIYIPWKRRIRFFRGNYIPGRFIDSFHGTYVDLDPKRIKEIHYDPKEDVYFVLYETDHIDYYKIHITKIPEDATELKELKETVCGYCGTGITSLGDEPICYNKYCPGKYYPEHKFIEKIIWRKEAN